MPGAQEQLSILDIVHKGWWWRNHGILMLNLCLLLPLITSSVNGLDSSLLNGLQILPFWKEYFNYPGSTALGVINSAQNIGGLVALPFTPYASDILGRRAALFTGSIIMLSGVATQYAASTVHIFIAARVLIGFGLAFSLNAAPLLITELAYPTQRGKITSVYNSSWYAGSIISAWVCYAANDRAGGSIWSWKIPTLAQALAPILQICLIWFIPESPRFLVSKGMESQASKILARYHTRNNDERDPLVVFEMAQIRHALSLEKDINKAVTYKSIFTNPGHRKRIRIIIGIAAFSQWSGNGLVSYYIDSVLTEVGIRDAKTKSAINGGLQIFNFCVALSGSFLVDLVGRRTLFLISNTGMLIDFAMWTLTTALFQVYNNEAAAKATIPLIFIFFLFYDIAYTPMLVSYTLEILPYTIRAKGFAIMNLTVYITEAFNQFFNPWALRVLTWKYYLVYVGWLVIELLFVLTYIVETKDKTLEETAAIFDGDQAKNLKRAGGEAATSTLTQTRTINLRRNVTAQYVPEKWGSEIELTNLPHGSPSSLRTQSDTPLVV